MSDEQQVVYEQLKEMLSSLVPPLAVLKDVPGDFQITATKHVVIDKRKMAGVWFAGLKMNKAAVTLHFLPVYGDPKLSEKLPPAFMQTLKGKACFHFAKISPELEVDVKEALEIGLAAYKSRDWL